MCRRSVRSTALFLFLTLYDAHGSLVQFFSVDLPVTMPVAQLKSIALSTNNGVLNSFQTVLEGYVLCVQNEGDMLCAKQQHVSTWKSKMRSVGYVSPGFKSRLYHTGFGLLSHMDLDVTMIMISPNSVAANTMRIKH